MSEETSKPATSGNHDGFEREDLNAKAVFAFLIGLAVICVLSYFILIGVYHYLDVYQRANQPPQNPLVAAKPETGKPTRAETKAEIKKDFPEPLLEEDEGGQLDSDRVKEEQRLNSYGWVDEKTGVVRIPIERAMELMVQRGLPVLPQSGVPAPAGAAKKPAGKTTAAVKQPLRPGAGKGQGSEP
ncbi:MAG: hypothetical protein LAO04_10270 [Acidobacteriia bacterium]|nr:hypothetical protein [Terriglobia bacterium]